MLNHGFDLRPQDIYNSTSNILEQFYCTTGDLNLVNLDEKAKMYVNFTEVFFTQ